MLYYPGLSKNKVTKLRLARLSELVLVFLSAQDQRRSKLIVVSGKCGEAAYCLRPSYGMLAITVPHSQGFDITTLCSVLGLS